jgi:hypothetical protein
MGAGRQADAWIRPLAAGFEGLVFCPSAPPPGRAGTERSIGLLSPCRCCNEDNVIQVDDIPESLPRYWFP